MEHNPLGNMNPRIMIKPVKVDLSKAVKNLHSAIRNLSEIDLSKVGLMNASKDESEQPDKVIVTYINHKGEQKIYTIVPLRFYHGSTAYYPEPCYLLTAYVIEKDAFRTFAMKHFVSWQEIK